jgi:CRP/FNR family transcriptional regulator
MVTTSSDYAFLRSLSLFAPLSDDALESLTHHVRRKKFRRRQLFFSQDEPADILYILEMGKVEIFKSDENGKKLTLWHIEEGQPFCLANMFAGRAFANAVALTDCLCYYIKKEQLSSFLSHEPELSQQFITCISSKLAAYSMLLEDFTFKNIEERLVKLLLKTAICEEGGRHVCGLTQNDIASLLGTCREVVSRTIKKLKKRGLISTESVGRNSRIVVSDLNKLIEAHGDGS